MIKLCVNSFIFMFGFTLQLNKSKEGLDRLQNDLPESSEAKGSLVDLQGVLSLTEHLQDGIEQEHHTLTSLQHHVARLLGVSNLQQLKVCPQICQDLKSLQGHCRRFDLYTHAQKHTS